jgi:alkanesulfonate monooxygenase SsuD/methylene tetrahydromethanopterin reductase-like flavin-dependent oxidoreductase (luciferase family)
MRRVAELGDGWHAAFASPAVMREGLETLRAACDKVGRDVKTITLSVRMAVPAKRPAAEMIEELKALREVGVSHVVAETRVTDVDDSTRILERFVSEVRAKL